MKTLYKIVNVEKSQSKLILEERDKPDLQSGEILVEVKASAAFDSDTQAFHALLTRLQRLQVPAGLTVAGVISEVGPSVSFVSVGDRVAGILSVNAGESGFSEYCVLEEGDVVTLPDDVDYADVAGCLCDALKAYTALGNLAHVTRGDTVFVFDGGSSWGRIVVQLARLWGAKVITSVTNMDDLAMLVQLPLRPALTIEMTSKMKSSVSQILEETGHLGVDVVIDNGVRLFDQMEDCLFVGEELHSFLPTKHDITSMLAAGGRWVTSHHALQLDPPNSDMLYLKGASVSFLNPYIWTLCPTRRGRLLHIFEDLLKRLKNKELRIKSPKVLSFTSLLDSIEDGMESLESGTVITM